MRAYDISSIGNMDKAQVARRWIIQNKRRAYWLWILKADIERRLDSKYFSGLGHLWSRVYCSKLCRQIPAGRCLGSSGAWPCGLLPQTYTTALKWMAQLLTYRPLPSHYKWQQFCSRHIEYAFGTRPRGRTSWPNRHQCWCTKAWRILIIRHNASQIYCESEEPGFKSHPRSSIAYVHVNRPGKRWFVSKSQTAYQRKHL